MQPVFYATTTLVRQAITDMMQILGPEYNPIILNRRRNSPNSRLQDKFQEAEQQLKQLGFYENSIIVSNIYVAGSRPGRNEDAIILFISKECPRLDFSSKER